MVSCGVAIRDVCVWLAVVWVVMASIASAQETADSRCNGAMILHGSGFVPDRERCDCWIRCTFSDNGLAVKSERQCCACGTLWDQDFLTCRFAREVSCRQDKCAQIGRRSYDYVGNCRAYQTCEGRRTASTECCEFGQRYNDTLQMCVDDSTCQADCLCRETTTASTPTCEFETNNNDPHTYFAMSHGRPVLMPCAPGTDYNPAECKCNTINRGPPRACGADFVLNCTNAPLTDEQNNVYVENTNVEIDDENGGCYFNGLNTGLMVPRFMFNDWRDQWAVMVEFDSQRNWNQNGPLFSNSACTHGDIPSIMLGLVRDRINRPRVEVAVRAGTEALMSLNYRPQEVNKVYLSYLRGILSLCVRDQDGQITKETLNVGGLTKNVLCAVRIGRDGSNRFYRGMLRHAQVYVNCVPDDFC